MPLVTAPTNPIFMLDAYVPWLAFAYGCVMFTIAHSDRLQEIGRARLPENLWLRLASHRPVAWVCFWVGGLWLALS